MKIPLLAYHPHADGKLDEGLWFTKHFWSFTGKKY